MKKKKSIIIVVVCVLAAAGIAAGIYGMTRKKGSPEAVNDSTAQTVQEQTTQEVKNPHAGQAQSVISGKWESSELAQQKAVAVMYSNIKQAMPQSNISKAILCLSHLWKAALQDCAVFLKIRRSWKRSDLSEAAVPIICYLQKNLKPTMYISAIRNMRRIIWHSSPFTH